MMALNDFLNAQKIDEHNPSCVCWWPGITLMCWAECFLGRMLPHMNATRTRCFRVLAEATIFIWFRNGLVGTCHVCNGWVFYQKNILTIYHHIDFKSIQKKIISVFVGSTRWLGTSWNRSFFHPTCISTGYGSEDWSWNTKPLGLGLGEKIVFFSWTVVFNPNISSPKKRGLPGTSRSNYPPNDLFWEWWKKFNSLVGDLNLQVLSGKSPKRIHIEVKIHVFFSGFRFGVGGFLVVFLLGEIEARDTQSSRNLEVHIMGGVTGNHGDVSTVEGLQEMWMMPVCF